MFCTCTLSYGDECVGDSVFDGEYWNVNAETSAITRFQFARQGDHLCVFAWGSCFPEDCEWGDAELHLLSDDGESPGTRHAFATWEFDSEPSHCLFAMHEHELTVNWISIQSDIPSYKMMMTFRKDAARSAAAQNPDPIAKFKHMWDGSEPGWKLIQYDTDVFLVEFNFADAGPTRSDIPALIELVGMLPNESEDEMWERLRGCSGIGLAKPQGRNGMNRLHALQRENDVKVTFCTIGPDDYLVLSPDGNHYGWINLHRYRRPVVARMISADVPVVSGHVE